MILFQFFVIFTMAIKVTELIINQGVTHIIMYYYVCNQINALAIAEAEGKSNPCFWRVHRGGHPHHRRANPTTIATPVKVAPVLTAAPRPPTTPTTKTQTTKPTTKATTTPTTKSTTKPTTTPTTPPTTPPTTTSTTTTKKP